MLVTNLDALATHSIVPISGRVIEGLFLRHTNFTCIQIQRSFQQFSTKPNLRRAKHQAGSLQRFPYAMSYIGTYHILLQRKFTALTPSLTLDLIYHQHHQSLRKSFRKYNCIKVCHKLYLGSLTVRTLHI